MAVLSDSSMNTMIIFAWVGPESDQTVSISACSLSTADDAYAERALRRWSSESTLHPAARQFADVVQGDFLAFISADRDRPLDLVTETAGASAGPSQTIFVHCALDKGFAIGGPLPQHA